MAMRRSEHERHNCDDDATGVKKRKHAEKFGKQSQTGGGSVKAGGSEVTKETSRKATQQEKQKENMRGNSFEKGERRDGENGGDNREKPM